MHHPTDRTAHTTACVVRILEHWIEWEIAGVHHEGLIQQPITPWADVLPWSYISVRAYVCVYIYIYLSTDLTKCILLLIFLTIFKYKVKAEITFNDFKYALKNLKP